MLIYGAGGHARVLLSILQLQKIPVHGIFDDRLATGKMAGIPIIGAYHATAFRQEQVVIAVGNNAIRKSIAARIEHAFASIIHPASYVDQSVKYEAGSVVMHSAIIQAESQLGCHVIVNTGSIVEHHCTLDDYVHVGPGAILCGQIRVGEGTLIGAGSIICPNINIGKNCMIAAGSVVTRHIPDHAIVRGNPARVIKTTDTL